MSSEGKIVSVNVSVEKGTIKLPVESITIDDRGVVGDAHAGAWHRQVSVLGSDSIGSFIADTGRETKPGEFAENLTMSGIDLMKVAILDRLRIGEVELEISQIGKECHGDKCAIFREVGKCVMPKEGIFCRFVTGGEIRPGDAVEYIPRTLKIALITLSDRASAGEYTDRSGPRARQLIEEFFAPTRWREQIDSVILPDEADQLTDALNKAIADGVDVIFTLGGTGVGPRDIAPETVSAVCDKIVPGIMESIRLKYSANKPSVLLSRGVAGVAGLTQLYALPGSVRAVEEYLAEIFKTLEHTLFMLHGLDVH